MCHVQGQRREASPSKAVEVVRQKRDAESTAIMPMTRRWGLRVRVVFVELVAVSVNHDAFAPIGGGGQ